MRRGRPQGWGGWLGAALGAAWLGLALPSGVAAGPAAPPSASSPAATDELVVAVYLPGVYFAQLSGKLELGKELAAHLQKALGRPVTSRVYATAEDLEHDSARLTLALVEAPYVAAHPSTVTPLCVSLVNGKDETRMVILGGGELKDLSELQGKRLAYSGLGRDEMQFLENFVLEGEMTLRRELLEPGRDAASALSKIGLRRADAVLLYEGDAGEGRQAGLRVLYESAYLPRPTLVTFTQGVGHSGTPVALLRDAMSRFVGAAHPQIRAFRPAVAERYQTLRGHIGSRARRLPPALELFKDEPPVRLPVAQSGPLPLPPVRIYAP